MTKVRLNRFPKMMILQYCRAILLGFNEIEAKRIGYAEALKYAIFKNKAFKPKSKTTKKGFRIAKELKENPKYEINPYFKLYMQENYPVISDKIITEEYFDKELLKKDITSKRFQKIYNYYMQVLKQVNPEILENESKFFNKIWKPIRDINPLEYR